MVLTSSIRFRHIINGSLSFVSSGLTWSGHARPFPNSLTTTSLKCSSCGWFGACAFTPAPRGPPSSLVQHGCRCNPTPAFVAHYHLHHKPTATACVLMVAALVSFREISLEISWVKTRVQQFWIIEVQ